MPVTGYKPRTVQPVVIQTTPTRLLASIRTCSFGNNSRTEFSWFPLKIILRCYHNFLQRHDRPELQEICLSLHKILTHNNKKTPHLKVTNSSETYKISNHTNHVKEITRQSL